MCYFKCYAQKSIKSRCHYLISNYWENSSGGQDGDHFWWRLKGFPLKAKSLRNTATYQILIKLPSNPPCATVGVWLCVYVRGLSLARAIQPLILRVTEKEEVDFVFLKERQILAQAPVPGKPIIANPGLIIANRGMSFLRYIFLQGGGQKTR